MALNLKQKSRKFSLRISQQFSLRADKSVSAKIEH